METYKNLKKGTKIGLAASIALSFLGIICSIFTIIRSFVTNSVSAGTMVHTLINFGMLIIVFVYAAFGYKKPHGNMLRFVFLLFAVYALACGVIPPDQHVSMNAQTVHLAEASLLGFSALLISYVGGRLDKIEKNKIVMFVISIVMLASVIVIMCSFSQFIFAQTVGFFSKFICWTALSFAYLARYEEHKAAGLADKADAEEK